MSVKGTTGQSGSGFTLVELIVALSLLLLVTVAMVPLFGFVAQSTQSNQRRLVATKLASSVIEQIRAMDYDNIGNCAVTQDAKGKIINKTYPYALSGQVPRQIFKIVENVQYTITTNIKWSSSRHEDYKEIDVEVEAPNEFGNKAVTYADLHTTVARKGEEKALTGGAVTVTVNLYNPDDQPYDSAGGVDVILKSEDNQVERRATTGDDGMAVFQDVPVTTNSSGDYQPRSYYVTFDDQYAIINGDNKLDVEINQRRDLTLSIKEKEYPN